MPRAGDRRVGVVHSDSLARVMF